jgi:hypothetical protein
LIARAFGAARTGNLVTHRGPAHAEMMCSGIAKHERFADYEWTYREQTDHRARWKLSELRLAQARPGSCEERASVPKR